MAIRAMVMFICDVCGVEASTTDGKQPEDWSGPQFRVPDAFSFDVPWLHDSTSILDHRCGECRAVIDAATKQAEVDTIRARRGQLARRNPQAAGME